jgi:hypothetical protein
MWAFGLELGVSEDRPMQRQVLAWVLGQAKPVRLHRIPSYGPSLRYPRRRWLRFGLCDLTGFTN